MLRIFLILTFVSLGFLVLAQQDDPFSKIVYPVAELGNCQDKNTCQAYCDKPENMSPCLDFAEAHDLVPEKEIKMARKMLAAGQTSGPGGCQGQAQCGTYCDDMSHIKECVAFAEQHDLMPPEELAEAKKVAKALERGVQPPPCSSKSECDDICVRPENMKSCIIFAKEAGLMPPEDLEEVEKVLAALEKGITPPPCGRKEQCDEYCALPENFETCINFAEAAGFMSPEEVTMARRTGGKGPGNCRGKEACEQFCEDPAHGEECINFAMENGFMSAEEAEQAKKMLAAGMNMMQGGPGGCKGKDQCEAYCDDSSHMTECVDFAEKAGFMSPEDAARAREMAGKGMNMIQGGPGGCKGEEECRTFCEDPSHGEECINFSVQMGEMTPEQAEEVRKGMEMMRQGGSREMMPPEGMIPPEGGFTQPPSQEEIQQIQQQMEQQIQQQMQQQTEQQIQQQMEQQIQQQTEQQIQQQIQQQMEQMMPSQY